MSDKKTMDKMRDISGIHKAMGELLLQAWERGYKYGYLEANEKRKVKVLIDGKQVFPKEPPAPC